MVLAAAAQEALDDKAPRRAGSMAAEIPVWVNSRQRWVTGIGRKTTCDDVIGVLLRDMPGALDTQGYVIMERWRRVERPLDSRARILKVWNAWGDAQGEVRLTLRRVDGEADSGRGSPTSSLNRRRRHNHRTIKLPWPSHQTLHPRRLAQLHHQPELNNKLPETIERLMKLILAQGETIQNQLRRLQDRDHQIEHLEEETHRSRVETIGSNYLLDTYLGNTAQHEEEEKENDSGVVTEVGSDQASPVSSTADNNTRCQLPSNRHDRNKDDDDEEENFADESDIGTKDQSTIDDATMLELQSRIELWEKLVKVNRRLEREEECLVRLHIKFRRYHNKQASKDVLRVLPEEELDEEGCHLRDTLLGDLERARLELDRGARELERTSLALAETESLMDARRHYLRRLHAELEASDKETDRLQQQIVTTSQAEQQVASEPGEVQKSKQETNINDTDSNSDTGLSSLHSGSEEGVYILDTLV